MTQAGSSREASPSLAPPQAGDVTPPVFLVPVRSWWGNFSANLLDLLLFRPLPAIHPSSLPGCFWPDVFVSERISWRALFDSALLHIAVVLALFGVGRWELSHPTPTLRNPFDHATLAYYPISEYLPPIEGPGIPAHTAKKAEPVLARQKIISVPPGADNHRQTIITPPDIKLDHDIRLPNIVAWNPVMPMQPLAASERPISKLKLPRESTEVVGPAPDVSKIIPRDKLPYAKPVVVGPAPHANFANKFHMPAVSHEVVGPAPEIDTNSKLTIPADLIQSAVVPPPISTAAMARRPGALNIARYGPQKLPPSLPVAEQRASEARGSRNVAPAAGGATGQSASSGAPASPSIAGIVDKRGAGQIIALSTNPAEVHGPINIPVGNRRGSFAAGPEGKPGASGSPGSLSGTSEGNGAHGGGNGAGNGNSAANSPLAGITVAPPPGNVSATPGVGSHPSFRELAAALARTSIPRPATAPPQQRVPESPEDRAVFGNKRVYALTQNLPNFNSATGSWVVHFAELSPNPAVASEISTPVVIRKSDPAYPPQAVRDGIEGTVVLYAVIRADGSVTGVRVLNSVDKLLDQAAVRAFSQWHFRPGTKNGTPIAVEAVVRVPFHLRKAF